MLQSDPEARIAIGPFLKNPALRRVIQTFTNDPEGDLARWATNPEVLKMGSQKPLRFCVFRQRARPALTAQRTSPLSACTQVGSGSRGTERNVG